MTNTDNSMTGWEAFADSFNEPPEPQIKCSVAQFYAKFPAGIQPRYVESINACQPIPKTENYEVYRQTCMKCGHTELVKEDGGTPFYCHGCKAGIERPTLLDHQYTTDRDRERGEVAK